MTGLADWPTRRLTARTRWLRRLLWPLLYGLAVRLTCRPLEVGGLDASLRRRLESPEPLVVVANHASHADTALLSLLVGRVCGARLVPAAAEDHFFRPRWLGVLVATIVGALPFPRQGRLGIDRCRRVLADGDHVLLFPEGSRDGGPFRPGVGLLTGDGLEVLPVHLHGTHEVLPKGRVLPRRSRVTVTFGSPESLHRLTPQQATRALEHAVHGLAPETADRTGRRGADHDPADAGHRSAA